MKRELKISTGTFDQENTFQVATNRLPVTCSLMRDYEVAGDGIYWGLNSGTVLKSSYSEKDAAERARFAKEKPIASGDVVIIEGEEYIAKVNGAYSDAVVFKKAAAQ